MRKIGIITLFLNIIFSSLSCYSLENKKLKFFNIDLHIGVIGDLKYIFESLGHQVDSKNISNQTWVLNKNKDEVKVISQNNWEQLNPEMVERFYQEYKDLLKEYDAFIVTHAASFALLYEKFDKPIIIVNSTRYSNKFVADKKRLNWLNEYLKHKVSKGKIFIVSNNKGDQNYLKYYTGIDSELIPSLCLYTKAQYTGKQEGFIIKDRLKINPKDFFINKNLIKRIRSQYKWQELYDFQGIIHFPYQISTMSIFEQYSANVPLFFPTKDFLLRLHKEYPRKVLSELSFFQVMRKSLPKEKNNPDNIKDEQILKKWIDFADYYNVKEMPYIQYFNSFADLEYILKHSDLKEISRKMAIHNKNRKDIIFKKWKAILQKVQESMNN